MHKRPAVLLLAAVAATAAARVPRAGETFPWDQAHPAAGTWVGHLAVAGASRYANVRLERDDDGRWSGQAIVVSLLAVGSDLADVKIDGRSAAFTVKGQAASARFEGTVSDDGQRITGTAVVTGPGADGLEAPFEFTRAVETMTLPGAMAFTGTTEIQGVMRIGMTLAFAPTPGGQWTGHVDVPAQLVSGYILADVARDGSDITATMPGPMPATFDLVLAADEQRLTGSMTQGPYTLAIDFARDEGYVGTTLRRPQLPQPPFPYRAEDVVIPHPEGHHLAGTLTLPDAKAFGEGPYPAAVLVSGSGPQDRDETLLGHKPFLVLADHLTRHGIAVLRYDDRGWGGSTGSFQTATTADFATDAAAAVAYLRQREEVDPGRIGVIGHSEGGLVAPMVAARDPRLAYIVLLAGPGVPGADVLRVQVAKLRRAAGADDKTIARALEHQAAIHEIVQGDLEGEALEAAVRPKVEAALRDEAGGAGDVLEAAVDSEVGAVTSPWFRAFLSHDPRDDLARVRCPVLAVNGSLDLQVAPEQNLPEIERVLKEHGVDVTVRVYKGLNHLFQPATTGSPSEYATIETTMDPRVLDDVTAWILGHVQKAP